MKFFQIGHHYENRAGKHIVICGRTRRYLQVLFAGVTRNFLIRRVWKDGNMVEYITDCTAGPLYKDDYTWTAVDPSH